MAGNCVSLNTGQNISSITTITFKAGSPALNTVWPKSNTTKPQQGPPQIQNQLGRHDEKLG
ncbi:MAG: hypothetical protein CBC46_06880 [Verrucomicrobiaceae bacterium TMED86]|nr:MAG: hypothetical protein CBC46_06880 [Verrucomicrobiaceae bacterium TMED86]